MRENAVLVELGVFHDIRREWHISNNPPSALPLEDIRGENIITLSAKGSDLHLSGSEDLYSALRLGQLKLQMSLTPD